MDPPPNVTSTDLPVTTSLELTKKYAGSTETMESDNSKESEDIDCISRTRRIFKSIYQAARSIFGLILIFLLYSILGALLFMVIESRNEQHYKTNIRDERASVIEQILKQPVPVSNTTIESWKTKVEGMLLVYEDTIREAVKNNIVSDSTVEVWTIWSSLFFVFTVYTTIGYGNLAPVTPLGRLVCIVYAAIGIPLALLLLAELGKRFTVVLKYLWAYVRRYYNAGYFRKFRNTLRNKYKVNGAKEEEDKEEKEKEEEEDESKGADTKSTKSSTGDPESGTRSRSGSRVIHGFEIDDEFNLPISVAIGILFIYLLLGAIMYCLWEDWGFIESIYFVFVSLSTIGFGDVLPAHQKFFIFSSVYMYIGLSLVSMCINVAIEFFNKAADRAKVRMEEAKKKFGDKAKMAHRNAKEKVADMRTNIRDETTKFRQRTDENISTLKRNIAGKTSNILEKTDGKWSEIRNNISEETSKFRKKADDRFRKRAESPKQMTPPPKRHIPRSNLVIEKPTLQDHTYEDIDNVKDINATI